MREQGKPETLLHSLNNKILYLSLNNAQIPSKEIDEIKNLLDELQDNFRNSPSDNTVALLERELGKCKRALNMSQKLTNIGNWETDIQTGKLVWSDEMYRIFGYEPGEIKDIDFDFFLSHIHPEDKEMVARKREESKKTNSFKAEFRIISKDGSEKIISAMGECASSLDGKALKLFGTNQDITKYKKTEDRLKFILDATSDGIWELDLKTNMMRVEGKLYLDLGFQNGETIPMKHLRDLVYPEDLLRLDNQLAACSDNKSYTFDSVCRIRKTNGEYFWYLVRGSLIKDASGKAVKALGSIEDLAIHKRMDQLKERIEFQQKVLDAIPVPVFYKGKDGKYLGFNNTMADLLDLTSDIIGKSFSQRAHENKRPNLEKLILKSDKELIEGGGQTRFEINDISIDGNKYDFIVYKAALPDSKGQTEYIVGAAIDISKIKKAQKELETAEEKLNTILNSMKEVILRYDKDWRAMWANREAHEVLNKNEGEIIGKYCHELWFKTDKHCENCPMENANKKGEKQEKVITLPDGRIYDMTCYPVIEKDGKIGGVVKVALDVTESVKNREKAEIQKEQLLQADKMKSLGTLVSGVAHEINNPNNYIMMNISVLKEVFRDLINFKNENSETFKDTMLGGFESDEFDGCLSDLVSGIEEGAMRIRGIVDSLKEYSRRTPVDLSASFEINYALKKSLQLLGNLIKTSTSSLTVSYAENIPKVQGDMHKIEQVIVNVLQNACDALEDKSKGIAVRTYFDAEKKMAALEVKDEGKGIPPENIEHVTDPFFTTKKKQGGTGLGLSVSSNIMDEHRAKLEIDSLSDKGSTVRMLIPIAERKL